MSKKASEHGRAVLSEMRSLGLASAQRGDERERRFAELHRMVNKRTLRYVFADVRLNAVSSPSAYYDPRKAEGRAAEILESLIQLAEHRFGGTAK